MCRVSDDRQQLGLALGEPFPCCCALAFWTVPITTAVVGDGGIGAVLAARDMAAECRRAAGLDRRHDLQLVEAHMAGIGLPPCRPMVADEAAAAAPAIAASLCSRLWHHYP